MTETVEITLNDRVVRVPAGARLIDVCGEQGLEIPRFCYHPALPVVGQCRMCQVEMEGPGRAPRRMGISCRTEVAPGLKVWTHSEAAHRARQGTLEFLLKDHPLDCPICDKAGECPLQNYSYEEQQGESRSIDPKRKREKRVDLGEKIVLDRERCVLCTVCVRYFEVVEGAPQLGVFGMGNRSYIGTAGDQPLTGNYQGNITDICPVGALTSKDFRFQARVWHLQKTPTVCGGCSRGCNITLEVHRGKAKRIRPRENHDVNGWWICDAGRYGYHALNLAQRLGTCLEIGADEQYRERSLTEAVERAAELLRKAGGEALLVASPYATNEEGARLLALAETLGATAHVLRPADSPLADDVLHTKDRGPNRRGLEDLGLVPLPAAELRAALAGERTVFGIGDRLLELLQDEGASGAPSIEATFLAVAPTPLPGARLVFPGRTWSERAGTWTNVDGRAQRTAVAMSPPTGSLETLEVLGHLAATLTRAAEGASR